MNPAPKSMGVLASGAGTNEGLNKGESRMDHYDILEQVGKGAFGAAILVVHRTERQKYVMKKIRLARQSERAKRSAYQEMRLVSTLSHPHIVSCHDCWVEKGVYVCIVTGYCEGGDVADLLRRAQGRLFSEGRLIKWLVQILLALQYIHKHKVLHRDLKCSNLFLTREGDIRVGDFGLARILEENQLTTSVVGTPNYMCPELLADQPYGFKSDVWSLGCCMYELTGHRPPFKAFDMQGLIQKITRGAVPPLPAEYSDEWKAVIKSMLKKIPDQRPSVDDLLEHPYLAPYVKACQRRVAEASAQNLPQPESPLLEPSFQETTAQTDQRRVAEVSIQSSPQPESPPLEPSSTQEANPLPIVQTDGLSASADVLRLRKSAEGRIEDKGFEVSNVETDLLRRSAESVQKSESLEGFGPEPSSSPLVVIGSRIRTGGAASPSVNPESLNVNRYADVSSRGGGVEEGDVGGEGFAEDGKRAGESGFVAARVQNLEALTRRNSIWMGGTGGSHLEIAGDAPSNPVGVASGVGAKKPQELRTGALNVGARIRYDSNSDSQSERASGRAPGTVTSQKGLVNGSNGNRMGQSTADSNRQFVQIGATESRLASTEHSSRINDVTATSAMGGRQPGNSNSGYAARKEQLESARTPLKTVTTPSSKKAEFQKRVPALGIPGVPMRTGSKGSASSSASTTPSQPSPRTPLPKQKPAWGASPKTPVTPKSQLNPKTLRTDANPGSSGRKPLPTRPATAPPRNSAAAKKMTSATLPARPQTAVRSGLTRGTIPGVAGKGLTATAERAAKGGKQFDFAAVRKGAVSKVGAQNLRPAKEADSRVKAQALATIDEHVGGGGAPVVSTSASSKDVIQPEQVKGRPENGATREGESQPKEVVTKSSRLGSLVRSIFAPRSSNTPKAAPSTPGKSPKPASNGVSPRVSNPSSRPLTPTRTPGSSGLVSFPSPTPGSTPRGSVPTPGSKLKPSTTLTGRTPSKTPSKSAATRPGENKLVGENIPVAGVKTPVRSPRPPSPLKSRPASAANTPTPKTPGATGQTLLKPFVKPSSSPRRDLSANKPNRQAVTPTGRASQASTPRKVSSLAAGTVAGSLTPELSPLALARAELKRRGFSPSSVGSSPEAALSSGAGSLAGGRSVADTLALNVRVNELEDILARCCRLHNQQRFEELGALLTTVAQASAALGEMVGMPAGAGAGELERALSQGQAAGKALEPADFQVGDPVLVVHRNQPGVVRFKGLTQFGNGEWVGVELQVPAGKHNGTWQGVTYFACPDKHGIFVRATSLELRAEVSPVGLGPSVDISGDLSTGGANVSSSVSPGNVDVSSGLVAGDADVSSTGKVAKGLTNVDVLSRALVGSGQPRPAARTGNVHQANSDVIRATDAVRGLLVSGGSAFERSGSGLERQMGEAALAFAPFSLRNSYESPRSIRPMSPAKRRLFSTSREQPDFGFAERDENAPLEWNPRSASPMRQRAFTQGLRSPSPLKQRAGPSSPLRSVSGRLLSPPPVTTSPETAQGAFSPVRRER